jgi:hypothetical protein
MPNDTIDLSDKGRLGSLNQTNRVDHHFGSHRPAKVPRLGVGLILAGAGLIPWVYLLATHLPARAMASGWSTAWVGLDALEILGLIATGWLLVRGDERHHLAAAFTATLFICDAWFDVTTSAPGFERGVAIAMALCAELPTAIVLSSLAVRRSRSATTQTRSAAATVSTRAQNEGPYVARPTHPDRAPAPTSSRRLLTLAHRH